MNVFFIVDPWSPIDGIANAQTRENTLEALVIIFV